MMPVIAALLAVQAAPAAAPAAQPPKAEAQKPVAKPEKPSDPSKPLFQPTEVKSAGSVTVGGRRIPYHAVAGTLVVHSKDWSDTDPIEAAATKKSDKDDDLPKAEASMFYTAYFRDGAPSTNRPIRLDSGEASKSTRRVASEGLEGFAVGVWSPVGDSGS